MRRWFEPALVQIMTFRLLSAKQSLTNIRLLSIGLLGTNCREILTKIKKLFIHENLSENIFCEMANILSRGTWVKANLLKFSPNFVDITFNYVGWWHKHSPNKPYWCHNQQSVIALDYSWHAVCVLFWESNKDLYSVSIHMRLRFLSIMWYRDLEPCSKKRQWWMFV